MPKNMIQFQKGMSIPEFIDQYGTEQQCRDILFKLRWPNGFVCPRCHNETYCEISRRSLLQCNRCHQQTSLIVGTIFQSTHLPLKKWFLAIFLLTQSKTGISALELSKQLGVSYNAAWRTKHKLMQVMLENNDNEILFDRIEIDDSYLGGRRSGGKRGRGAEGKTPFIAAVETDGQQHPQRIKLNKVSGFKKEEIKQWCLRNIYPGSTVVSDGLQCFDAVVEAKCIHEIHIAGGGKKAVEHPAFKWVNTILGNVKNSLTGTYHAIGQKHVPRYLAEFQYRFNHRFNLPSMIQNLVQMSIGTPPVPARLLTLAEQRW
jgi:transposase-like protein